MSGAAAVGQRVKKEKEEAMRRRHVGLGGAALLGAALAAQVAGCFFSAPDCELGACKDGTGTGGGAGGTPVGCVPSENDGTVGDECGVFVAAAGDDAEAGTKAAPMQTMGAAIARAMEGGGGARVYACAETFAGAVEVPAGVTIFGGLDCANGWGWVGETQKTMVEGAADEIALRVSSGEGAARIEDVAVRAADAVAAGGSSIAVMVDGATAELVRCELTAGNGAEGAQGAPGAEPDGMGQIPAAAAGMPGNPGVNACSDLDMSGMPDATLLGGGQVLNDCGSGSLSIGGSGGISNIANGGSGAETIGNPQTAAGGLGEPAAGAWSCGGAEPNGSGDDATDGMPGMPGPGATGNGILSSTGYAGVSGGVGTTGQPGQGGGGGGGAKGANAICPGALAGAGASGGSGGAGGCGGQPGQGGGPGGASIALASVNATVTLTGCRLTAGNGGRGGAGGDAQAGGQGGAGGPGGQTGGIAGIKAACDGGKGGQGGDGGPGGGGLGGPSAVIAYVGAAVVKDAATTLTPGTAGDGGPGGNADLAMNSGAAGAAGEELELP